MSYTRPSPGAREIEASILFCKFTPAVLTVGDFYRLQVEIVLLAGNRRIYREILS